MCVPASPMSVAFIFVVSRSKNIPYSNPKSKTIFLIRFPYFLFRLNIYFLMKVVYRINRNLGNFCTKPRDNDAGNNIFVMTGPNTIIAPKDLYNPFGSLTLLMKYIKL